MPKSADYIQTLKSAIRDAHGCEAKHLHSVDIEESFEGRVTWHGKVEVFELDGHPTAKRCYAWGHALRDTGHEVRIVTVLGVSPIDSARKAVQASILSDIKAGRARK
jgi:hypothetical protein